MTFDHLVAAMTPAKHAVVDGIVISTVPLLAVGTLLAVSTSTVMFELRRGGTPASIIATISVHKI